MDGEIEGDASTHTTSRMSDRKANVQIVGRVSGRRIWTVEQKLAIIGEAFSPGSSVKQTVERHEIGSGQLYTGARLTRVCGLSRTDAKTELFRGQTTIGPRLEDGKPFPQKVACRRGPCRLVQPQGTCRRPSDLGFAS